MPVSCETQDLIDASICFGCVPPDALSAIEAKLMCDWANGPVEPPGEYYILTEDGFAITAENGDELQYEH